MNRIPRPAGTWAAVASVLSMLLASCAVSTRIDTGSMSFSDTPLTGKVVWNDLITDDLAAARRFYGGLFGWTFDETSGPAGNDYLIARSGSLPVAGMVPVAPGSGGAKLSRWLPYVSVGDVDAAVNRATAAGATVAVGPRDVGLGQVAALIDPQGAVIGIARSNLGDPDDATTAPGLGRKVWTELLSNDPAASARFYEAVVGYQARTIARRGGEYTLLSGGGVDRAGILANPTGDWSPVWLTSFGVADASKAAALAASLGGTVLLAPSADLREGGMAVVSDPSGAILVLQELGKE
jgi:predicted enzyme related to lactoylglutathione lyase